MAVTGLTFARASQGRGPRGRFLRRLVAPVVLAAAFAFALFAPQLGLRWFRWPCPVYTVLRVPCPSCGLTRAARMALHGDFAGATHMHPLWMIVLPFVAVALAIEITQHLRGEPWGGAARVGALRVWGYAAVGLLVVVWLARFLGAFGGPCPEP